MNRPAASGSEAEPAVRPSATAAGTGIGSRGTRYMSIGGPGRQSQTGISESDTESIIKTLPSGLNILKGNTITGGPSTGPPNSPGRRLTA